MCGNMIDAFMQKITKRNINREGLDEKYCCVSSGSALFAMIKHSDCNGG